MCTKDLGFFFSSVLYLCSLPAPFPPSFPPCPSTDRVKWRQFRERGGLFSPSLPDMTPSPSVSPFFPSKNVSRKELGNFFEFVQPLGLKDARAVWEGGGGGGGGGRGGGRGGGGGGRGGGEANQ